MPEPPASPESPAASPFPRRGGRESAAARRRRMRAEADVLAETFPSPRCALDFDGPFQLVVATVLSAQTTDRRVNTVTPELFDRWPTPDALAGARLEDVEEIIRPLGFHHAKALHVIGLAQGLVDRYGGEVPRTMDELVTLPGVGRKTANVVLGNAFGVPGFPVDTHVMRVTGRLRWRTDWRDPHPDPREVERQVTACFPPDEWTDLSHRLILLGRGACRARRPDCASCPLAGTCPSAV